MRRFDAIKRRSEGLCGTLLMNYGRVELELIVKHEKYHFNTEEDTHVVFGYAIKRLSLQVVQDIRCTMFN